jgi:hypothetical protein
MWRTLWSLTRGYRLRPWRSPYLLWRIETYSGLHAGQIGWGEFWRFAWRERRELLRYLQWARRMRKRVSFRQACMKSTNAA